MMHANLLLGMSYAWWVQKHDAHHSNPNQLHHDPDVEILFLAFDEDQAREKRGIARFFVKYQAFFFFPLLLFQAFSLRYGSIDWLVRRRFKHRILEAGLIVAHFALFLTLVFYCLPGWAGVAFLAIHQGFMGLYLGSVFAPNHKGMPVVKSDCQLDYLHQQVLTARNVKGHPLIDFWYGGLNYQIEHHLFPNMPRNLLRKAQPLVKEFCRRHGIAYHETSMARSYKEILQHLHQVSASLRRRGRFNTAS
jgi:fatty acid desaturase